MTPSSNQTAADDPGTRVAAALRDMARQQPIVLAVSGDCMAPVLRHGDRVQVAPARRYWPGDIVALPTAQGRVAVHRLLGYRLAAGRWLCVTRGDLCASPDAPLPARLLLGRASVRPSLAARVRAVAAFAALAFAAARRRAAGRPA